MTRVFQADVMVWNVKKWWVHVARIVAPRWNAHINIPVYVLYTNETSGKSRESRLHSRALGLCPHQKRASSVGKRPRQWTPRGSLLHNLLPFPLTMHVPCQLCSAPPPS